MFLIRPFLGLKLRKMIILNTLEKLKEKSYNNLLCLGKLTNAWGLGGLDNPHSKLL